MSGILISLKSFSVLSDDVNVPRLDCEKTRRRDVIFALRSIMSTVIIHKFPFVFLAILYRSIP